MKQGLLFVMGGAALWAGVAGCQTTPERLPVEAGYDQIVVGQTDATTVLNLLPEAGMLQTASAISVLQQQGWRQELAVIKFDEYESRVERKAYIRHRSNQQVLLVEENLLVALDARVPAETLEQPFETETRKYVALLRYLHEQLGQDIRPFAEDRATESLGALGQDVLHMAILRLQDNPRQGGDVLTDEGFAFDHPVLGPSYLHLVQQDDDIFHVSVRAGKMVDPFDTW